MSKKPSEAVAWFNNLVDKLSQLPLDEAKQMTAERLKDILKLRALVDRRVQINHNLRDYVPPTQAERDAAWETRRAMKAAQKNAKDNPSPMKQLDGEIPRLKINLPPETVAALKARKAQN